MMQPSILILMTISTLFQDVVRKIEKQETGANNKPKKDCVIADSGTLPVEEAFHVEKKPAQE